MLENDLSPQLNQATIYLKDYQPPAFAIDAVNLHFDLQQAHTIVTAVMTVTRAGQHAQALTLDGEKMELLELSIDDNVLATNDYQLSDTQLMIDAVPDSFELTIKTRLQPHLNTELSGLYQSSGNFCTQCEAEGFRRITYYPDRPDVLSVFTVTMQADKAQCPMLLSNGNLQATGDNEDGTHWARWHDPHPKPSYLFALVAGKLECISDEFTTGSGQPVQLNIYTEAHNITLCDHAMTSLKNSMRWDEEVYGREYDLEIYNIVAVDDFNMGAMENKGLNVFNSKYVLANQQTATDDDYQGIESVIGHEYFHNWSGNRVTCRDWFQLSLKEGFTVFRDQEFSADMDSRAVKRIRDVRLLRNHQFKEDAGPMAHPVRPDSYQEINNFYTVTIYEKGAEVIRMMHSLVGAKGFRKATDLYFSRFDGQAVTTEDFVQCMEQANDIDLTQFRNWYTQAGTPVVEVTEAYDAAQAQYSLTLRQHCPATPGQAEKDNFIIPVQMALFDQTGNKLTEQTLQLTESEQTFTFAQCEQKPVASLLRGFSAPVKLVHEPSDEALALLMQHDDDGFVQWESGQQLMLSILMQAIDTGTLDENRMNVLQASLQELLHNTLAANTEIDIAIVAEMLQLPAASYIAEQYNKADPLAICRVREQMQQALATSLQEALLAVFERYICDEGEPFTIDGAAIAQRALKNTTLAYLSLLKSQSNLAEQQYHQADNMTDRIAAFSTIVHGDSEQRNSVIEHFYEQWQTQTLVLDKWFSIIATTPNEDVLSQVKALMDNASFSIKNPNKVRSLIGAFASNMTGFHQADGSGYKFVADMIVQLNEINPQIAARLSGVFNQWRKFTAPYSELMKEQLVRISEQPNLSKDTSEIVSKALSE